MKQWAKHEKVIEHDYAQQAWGAAYVEVAQTM